MRLRIYYPVFATAALIIVLHLVLAHADATYYMTQITMSAYYALVAVGLCSGAVALLPRSGMWMVWMKRAAALLMFAMAEYYFVRAGYNL